MTLYKYSSRDFYRILETIEKKVRDLTSDVGITRGGRAYQELLDYITKEREACYIRVARATAEDVRRKKAKKTEDSDG